MDVRTMIKIARLGFAAVVLTGLLFGAQTVWGSTTSRSECVWHPPTYLGSCGGSQAYCQELCEFYNTERPVLGECSMDCCSCLI